ncbi:MAG: YbfB/YjiJ family MFS transporter [Anderseniella sp.]
MSDRPSPAMIAFTGCLCLILAMGIGRFAYTPVLPVMLADGLLDMSSAGAIASVHFIGYAMGAFAAAYVITAPRAVLLGSLSLIAASTLAMGVVDNHAVWFGSRWLAGFCSALVLVIVSTYHVRNLSGTAQRNLQGWVFAGVGAGIMLVGAGVLAMMVMAAASQTIWLGFGGLALAATAYLFVQQADVFRAPTGTTGTGSNHQTPLSWAIILPYAAMGFGYVVPATYLPVMAKEILPSPLIFGLGWPVFGAAAAVSTILIGPLQTRYSNRQIWLASQLVMALGLLAPAISQSILAITIAALCVGGTFMVITMVGMKEAHRIAGPEDAQRHVAAMTFAFATGQIAGPFVAGSAFEALGSFSWPLVLAAGMLVISLVPMLTKSGQRSSFQARN